jgi:D-3-phosphoglycerate dehydrogenase
MVSFINTGNTIQCCNLPAVSLPHNDAVHRILNVHKNVPGVLRDVNRIVSDLNANIDSQILSTEPHIGYLIMDLDKEVSAEVSAAIAALPTSIRTRVLY